MTRSLPSRTALLERREERALIREGKEVLEERRDLLAQEMLRSIRRCEALLAAFTGQAEEAGAALRAAILQHGVEGINRFAEKATTLPDPAWRLANHAGVELLEPAASTAPAGPPETDRGFMVSPELERARLACQRLLEMAPPLAAEENNLRRLTAAFRVVRRRVNALEHVILPETEQAIREIGEGLEQMDREQMVSTLWMKRRMEGGGGR